MPKSISNVGAVVASASRFVFRSLHMTEQHGRNRMRIPHRGATNDCRQKNKVKFSISTQPVILSANISSRIVACNNHFHSYGNAVRGVQLRIVTSAIIGQTGARAPGLCRLKSVSAHLLVRYYVHRTSGKVKVANNGPRQQLNHGEPVKRAK